MEIDELAVKITGDSTSLQSAMNQATESMNKLGINTSKLTGLLGAAGLTAAFKMAYDAADKMIQAYRGDETALLKYNAALAASAVITAQGKRVLDDYVPVFASLSGIAEADTQAMIARLAAYGRTDEQIKTMMETALGMSAVLDMDVNTALTQLNMTFQGTAGRLGMQISGLKELTAEQLKNGDGLRLLNSKYGEFSQTLKTSTDVSIKNFENAWSDLMSVMGESIAKTINPLRDAITNLFRHIIDSISETNKLNEAFRKTADGTATLNDKLLIQTNILNNLKYTRKMAEYDPTVSKEELADLDKAIAAQQALVDKLGEKVTAETAAADAAKATATAAAEAAAAAKKATDDAIAAQIRGRKDAQKAYEDSLAQIDVKVRLGVMTEQEAADAKYAANQKLIDDLIALGYTGNVATGQIGDQALAAAVARNANLLANTKEMVDAIITETARILAQQQEVAAWEAAYLEKKKAEAEALERAHRRYNIKRLEATEEVTKKEDAAWAKLQNDITAGSSGTAQRLEQDTQNRIRTQQNYARAMANIAQGFAAEQTRIFEIGQQEALEAAQGIQRRYINNRLEATEEITRKEDIVNEKLQNEIAAGLTGTAQRLEQDAQNRIKIGQNYYNAMANLTQRFAKEQTIKFEVEQEEKRGVAQRFQKEFINNRLAAIEEITIKEEAANEKLQKEIINGFTGTAQRAEQNAQNKIKTEENHYNAMWNITQRFAAEQTRIYETENQERLETAQRFQRRYINNRLAITEEITIKEDAAEKKLQNEISAGLTGTAQLAEQMAVRRVKTEENHYNAMANRLQRFAAEQTRIYETENQERLETAQRFQRRYINNRLEATEAITIAEDIANEKLQNEISAGLTGTAQLAEQLAARKIKAEENYYNAMANLAKRRLAEEERDRQGQIEGERYTRAYAAWQAANEYTVVYQNLIESISKERDKSKRDFLKSLLDKVTAAHEAGATVQKINLMIANETSKFAAGQEIDSLYKRIAYNSQEAFDIQIKEWEELKTVFADDADRLKEINAIIEAIKDQKLDDAALTFMKYASFVLFSFSQLFSGLNNLIAAQTENAIDVVESRLEALKESYGSTAAELQTMYDALERMGAIEKATSIKAQLEKERAVEDYTSLTMEQLTSLYATAMELNNTQSAAEIAAAMDRVKAEEDAAEEIKKIQYNAAVSEWNLKYLSTIASSAQAVMEAYKSMMALGPVAAGIAAAAATAFGAVQIAAVAEAKPKLDIGGIVKAREDTHVAVGKGTSEIMLGTSALGDPLMQGFADLVASRVSGSGMRTLLPVQIVLKDKVIAESVVSLIDDGQVRFKKLKVAR